jgi:hypothetical protein
MRRISITCDLYPIGELPAEQQDRAYNDWLHSGPDYPCEYDNRETLDAFCKLFDVDCRRWEYGNNSYSYRFGMNVDERIEELRGLRLAKYIVNNHGHALFRSKIYWKNAIKRTSRIQVDTCCVLTGYCMDHDILAPVYAFLARPDPGVTFNRLVDRCLDQYFRACCDDREYYYSPESFKIICEGNDWEFRADGRRFTEPVPPIN